jgi:selenophosphate synthetase-related protein
MVRADPRLVGKLTARVALMELLAIGADPIAISGTFSVEPEPASDLVLEGIREEVRDAHIRELPIVCSSEKNFRVKQTGIGITAIGIVPNSAVKAGRCEQGDEIVAVGEPCVGREVIQAERNRKIADTLDVIRLRKNSFVHELIPVGSKGILYEANVMAKDSELFFEASIPQSISFEKSAGPATVLLVAFRKGSFTKVKRAVGNKPVRKIGTLRKR